MPLYIPNYQYSEDIPVQNWDIRDDTLTVAGYLCQKAVCRFRGRDYTAWFAMDIPLGNGPWKFGGLPGLILKVYDNEMSYIFECTHIEYHKQPYPVRIYDYKGYAKMERRKLLRLQIGVNEDWPRIGNLKISRIDGAPIEKIPYYPLELE
jgi:GLPGLI family protein